MGQRHLGRNNQIVEIPDFVADNDFQVCALDHVLNDLIRRWLDEVDAAAEQRGDPRRTRVDHDQLGVQVVFGVETQILGDLSRQRSVGPVIGHHANWRHLCGDFVRDREILRANARQCAGGDDAKAYDRHREPARSCFHRIHSRLLRLRLRARLAASASESRDGQTPRNTPKVL
jgi:hypothetical protein